MPIYGIDLGTTYSSLGYVDEFNRPVVIRNDEGTDTTPSVVFFEAENNVVVGKRAKNASRLYPDSVVAFIKRDMGNENVYHHHFGHDYRPVEVSALILKKLVADAAMTLGQGTEIRKVVITCPAYFGLSERSATKAAGERAGLEVMEMLDEPTAAALYYASRHREALHSVLVYDLGGGTFDVTVIRLSPDVQVIWKGGDHHLGGKEWDERIVDHLVSEVRRALPDATDPESNAETMQDFFNRAEELKQNLSVMRSTMAALSHEGTSVRVDITREQFEQMTSDLLEQTVEFTRTAISKSHNLGVNSIDKILLVGGSSKMPAVAARLNAEFAIPTEMFEPDLAVVKGAALRAHEIEVNGKKPENIDRPAEIKPIKDVCSHGLGIRVQLEQTDSFEVVHLIHAQQPLPVEVTERSFRTVQANQMSVRITVMEQAGLQESRAVEDNKEVAEGFITDIPYGLPVGSPIHVTFRMNSDGTLNVRAVEPTSGKNVSMELKIKGADTGIYLEREKFDGIAVG